MTKKISEVHKRSIQLSSLALPVFVILSLLFLWLAKEVRDNETLQFDNSLLLAINSTATAIANSWIVALTDLGGIYGVPVITVGMALLFFIRNRPGRASKLLVIVGGAVVINLLMKAFFERSRPELWDRLVVEHSFSFPSGHAMVSMALAGGVVYALWRTKYRSLSIIIGLIYVLLIGYSRLYLGVHYPTDVLAGWLVGMAWVILVVGIFDKSYRSIVLDSK